MAWDFSNGLLGMGGFGGGAMPTNSLLGSYYDPAEMRKYQMKQMLLGLGAGLMAEKGVGKGATLALAAGDRAGQNYREDALNAYKIKTAADDQAYNRSWDQKKFDYQVGQDKLSNARSNTELQMKLDAAGQPDLTEAQKNYLYSQQHPDFLQQQLQLRGAGAPKTVGQIPPGYTLQYDTNNNPTQLVPIPGGPAAAEAEKTADTAQAKADKRLTITDTITNAADSARQLADSWGATGLTGQALSNIGTTDAAEVNRQVNVLKSTATIENLNAMRRESQTGGALGNVTEKEGAMLAAAAGALDPAAGPERFKQQLDNYELTLMRIIHGYDAGTQLFEQRKAAGQAQSQQMPGSGATSGPGQPNVRKYNPRTGKIE